MASESLAVKYRPKTWNDVVEQQTIKQILNEQIKTDQVKRVLLFTGPAGCGKTTNARIFARELEPCTSNIVELNCADKNGVDDIRGIIIDNAKIRPLQGKYKIFILDENHMLTVQAQNALLKLLEEPPSYCIFILCTTDPQKILTTILSRAYRYDFQKISMSGIISRLNYILECEKNTGADIQGWTPDAINYIARQSNGGMRDAITLLDKCLSYTKNLTVDDVVSVLGVTNYDIQFEVLDSLIQKNESVLLQKIAQLYESGKDLKLFVKNFLTFVLDVNKFTILQNIESINIPNSCEQKLRMYNQSHRLYLKELLSKLVKLDADMRWETNPKTLLESTLLLEVI